MFDAWYDLTGIFFFFLQELKFVFPNTQQMNRGGQVSEVSSFVWPFLLFVSSVGYLLG